MSDARQQIVLVRHGETEWSRSARHTGRTDLPLTAAGRRASAALGRRLSGWRFAAVLTSPLSRASETAALAGLGATAHPRPDLMEWDYGAYEGLTSAQIRERAPAWALFSDGAPGGECPRQVEARVDRVLEEVARVPGDVALFSHGHLLRALAARWLKLDLGAAELLLLGTASVSVLLRDEAGRQLLALWNDQGHLGP